MILESLAANRGKTLYCAVDQSDTFTKAETWAAGKDRNERDDTVYYGTKGRFRGFLAAQEGYLTDGESGVTGISRARIFEFPEEPRKKRRRRRVTRTVELVVPQSSERRARELPAGEHMSGGGARRFAQRIHRQHYWEQVLLNTHDIRSSVEATRRTYWQNKAQTDAEAYCTAQGYTRVRDVVIGDLPANFVNQSTDNQLDDGWGYWSTTDPNRLRNPGPGDWRGRAYVYVLWSAVCEKEVRRRR